MAQNTPALTSNSAPTSANEPITFLSCEDIMRLFSCSETYFYTVLIKDPNFPIAINMGPRMKRWLAPQIRAYQDKLLKAHGLIPTTEENNSHDH